MSSSLAIETHGLTRAFGTRVAVNNVDLRVPRGCVYGFLGPNGAGKTTTIRLLLGLLRPSAGDVLLNGQAVTREKRDALRRVGALVETPSLYPHLTGEENLEVTRRLLDLPRGRISEVLDLFGLAADAKRRVHTYSTGMRQSLGLALAWLGQPSLLLLDEPTNGLDPAATRKLRALIRRLANDEDVTIFLSTHVLGEVEQIADWIGIIHDGQLRFQGELSGLKNSNQGTLEDIFLKLVGAEVDE